MTGKWSCKTQRPAVTRRKFSKRKCGESRAEWPRRGARGLRRRPDASRTLVRRTAGPWEKIRGRASFSELFLGADLSPFLGRLRMTLTAALNFSSVLISRPRLCSDTLRPARRRAPLGGSLVRCSSSQLPIAPPSCCGPGPPSKTNDGWLL
jgi:hypothetical protein